MKIVTIVLKISKKLYCYIPKYVDDEFHPICISGDAFLRRCHLQSLWIRKYGDILEYWKLLLNRKMFLKTLAKRRQKQCFAFPLTVEKICLTIFSVSLASSKLFHPHCRNDQTECVSLTWKHDMKKLRVNDHLNVSGKPWRSNELLSDALMDSWGIPQFMACKHRPGQLLMILTDAYKKPEHAEKGKWDCYS